jgi:hypothetical protein
MKLLFENWRKYLNEASPAADEMRRRIAAYQGVEATPAQSGYDIAMEKDPGSYYKRKAESDGYRDFNEETFGTDKTYAEQADHWEAFEDGKYLENYELGWQNAQIEHDLALENQQLNESLYYGTSTIFQKDIAENGIKSPSKWGDYSFAEENAMKIVEKHGGEPMVIQMPRSEFKINFLLDEDSENSIMYTEDLFIGIEKQEKKIV